MVAPSRLHIRFGVPIDLDTDLGGLGLGVAALVRDGVGDVALEGRGLNLGALADNPFEFQPAASIFLECAVEPVRVSIHVHIPNAAIFHLLDILARVGELYGRFVRIVQGVARLERALAGTFGTL